MRLAPFLAPVAVMTAAVMALVAASCSSGGDDPVAVDDASESEVAVEQEPAAEREPAVVDELAGSALPPRHLDTDAFPEALVDRALIVSGGPPPDGIPAIDDPTFVDVDSVDWLDDAEAVLVLELDDRTRIYPAQILMWHEIVNDEIDGRPVTVTFCPLCNSGVAFDRTVRLPSGETAILDFGTSGSLYQSAMVMYDRQTESLWTHFDARAVIGELVGIELDRIPLNTTAWSDARDAHPDAEVLAKPGSGRDYGRNPYTGYDQSDGPIGGFFNGAVDDRLPAMTRVVGIESDETAIAITLDRVAEAGVESLDFDGRRLVLWHEPGLASSLEAATVADGRDIGAVGVFVSDDSFERTADGFVDTATNSTWNIFGEAVSGPRTGEQLTSPSKIDTFWFAWSTYHPDTTLVE